MPFPGPLSHSMLVEYQFGHVTIPNIKFAKNDIAKLISRGSRKKDTLPSSSPNFTAVEFAVRCVMEVDVCAAPHSSTSILKQTRRTSMSNFVENDVRRWACFEKVR